MLAFYDSRDRLLRIALTGDSRAVLGRRTETSNGRYFYEVHVLSVDQNADNAQEVTWLKNLHPREAIVKKGLILGRRMSRAFGEGVYKWSIATQTRLFEEYLGELPPPDVKTPPYSTAEPEVTTVTVHPGDFLILGTKCLWESLTNEEAVGLVAWWLKTDDSGGTRKRNELPVKVGEDRTTMYRRWRIEKTFVNVDHNAATHLARNALGGANNDLTSALLNMSPPYSRKYR